MNVTRRSLRSLCFALTLSALAPLAGAETVRVIDASRVHLSDLTDSAGDDLGRIDLGAAPPPGSSRLFAREDLRRELRSQGVDPSRLKLPAVVRVQSASRRYSPADLDALVRARLTASLPTGVSLKQLKIGRSLVGSPRLAVGEVRLPKLVRRAGPATLTAMVELVHDGAVSSRLPVTLHVELSERAAAPLIDKGARVDLVIARGAARISASAIALEAAELGEIASFKVSTTHKVLRARVETSTVALVVTP